MRFYFRKIWIYIKFYLKNVIKYSTAFKMLTITFGMSTISKKPTITSKNWRKLSLANAESLSEMLLMILPYHFINAKHFFQLYWVWNVWQQSLFRRYWIWQKQRRVNIAPFFFCSLCFVCWIFLSCIVVCWWSDFLLLWIFGLGIGIIANKGLTFSSK